MFSLNDELPVIEIAADHLALMAAAVARVAKNESYKFPAGDIGLSEIGGYLNADISVYDRGENRFVTFFFQNGTIEVTASKRPPKPNAPEVPDFDPTDGTPGATTPPKLATAA